MIDAAPLPSVRTEFAKRAEGRREEEKRLTEFHRRKDKERERREDERETGADELTIAALATDDQVLAFTVELDAYDAATVEALQQNRIALDQVDSELELMLAQAFVLPDGRRVFKTEDGLRVFDENGQELRGEDIDPAAIDDAKPSWDRFSQYQEQRVEIIQQQQSLLDYQQQLDSARDRLAAGDITADELHTMDEDLQRNLPDTVSELLPEDMRGEPEAEIKANAEPPGFGPGFRLDMPTL